jgi:hypothetical protein
MGDNRRKTAEWLNVDYTLSRWCMDSELPSGSCSIPGAAPIGDYRYRAKWGNDYDIGPV